MKKMLLLSLCAMPFVGFAQSQLPTCGSTDFAGGVEDLDNWAHTYYAQPQTKSLGALTPMYLPTVMYLVAKTDGTGGVLPSLALAMLCDVNDDYRPHAIQFVLDSLDQTINNDAYNDPPLNSMNYYTAMLTGHKQANRVNLYLHGGGAATGLCGVYHGGAPSTGVVGTPDVVNCFGSCLFRGNTTMTHELGHYLAIPHTFYGLENGNNLACGAQATAGAPFNDPLCGSNGDRFCDTPPDYNPKRWTCNASGLSCTVFSTDNVAMQIDGTNYMSYSNDACAVKFTINQRDRMRTFITTRRANLLAITTVGDSITQSAHLVSPVNNYLNPLATMQLVWNKVPNATHYMIEVFGNATQTQKLLDVVVRDTTYLYAHPFNVSTTAKRWWRVTAFNKKYFCNTPSGFNYFAHPVGTENAIQGLSAMQIVPNPIQNNHFTIHTEAEKAVKTNLSIVDIMGRTVQNLGEYNISAGENTTDFSIENLPNGVYFVQMRSETGIKTTKIVVM
jgi:hypothetical protein